MPSFRCLLLFGSLLLILISVTDAITLDVNCANATQCGGSRTRCEGGICKCDTPWYTPCETTACDLRPAFVYEGNECREDAHCLNNAFCQDRRCKCKQDFTAMNGLCYKSLNTTCGSSAECWSNLCRDGVCKCPPGHAPRGDNNLCQRKFAKIYANWTYANESGDFCYPPNGTEGCLDINAQCASVLPNQESFCQCPPTYRADYEKQVCELVEYTGELSPSKTPLPYGMCGKCKDDNAVCALVDNQTTCWCRSGFFKNGQNQCEESKRYVVFPDKYDIGLHDYASPNCSVAGENSTFDTTSGLCTCAAGYIYVNKESRCQPIVAKWEDDAFEYGVCTHINSKGLSQPDYGLCPSPLACSPRQDKFVCACNGRDKYLSEDNVNCYHFLERNLTASLDASACPPDSSVNNTRCQCAPYSLYRTSADKRRCELALVNRDSEASCVVGDVTFNTTCQTRYGEYTRFCNQGECQCMPGKSFYQDNRCVTLLNVTTTNSRNCPQYAESIAGICQCKVGYRDKDRRNRACDRKSDRLYELSNAPTSSAVADVSLEDCRALYPTAPVKAHHNACICDDGTFLYNSTCAYYIDYPFLGTPGVSHECPENALPEGNMCKCKAGFVKSSTNRTCDRLPGIVYEYNVPAPNVTGITDEGCRNLFGYATQASSADGHCECLKRELAFWSDNKCYFLVEIEQPTVTPQANCAPGSEAGTRVCHCPHGYSATEDRRGCSRKNVTSANLQTIDTTLYNTPCAPPNNNSDCEALHGTGAVCFNATCYCDRRRSFVRGQRCELFSKFVFPGAHEHWSVTCNSHEDCGADAYNNGIECNFTTDSRDNYKVCKCKPGYLLNPEDSTCVRGRCSPQCQENEECNGYKCDCKNEYYRNPAGICVKREPPLILYERCNTTVWTGGIYNGGLVCGSTCQRARCYNGYRDEGSQCVKYNFDDSCFHLQGLCEGLDPNAQCLKDSNRCTCPTGFYRSEGQVICARAVDGPCSGQRDCGDYADCLNNRCRCKPGRRAQQVSDSLGRAITRCINGIGPMQFSPILLLFIALLRIVLG